MIEIKFISAEETYQIRKEILRKNIPLSEKTEGDFDKNTFHLGAYYNNRLVCVATFMQSDSSYFSGNQYRLRGMATQEEFQGKGFGRRLILKAETVLNERKATVLWCNARVAALNFYKKIGFKTIGTAFDIHLIGPHYVMFKKMINA